MSIATQHVCAWCGDHADLVAAFEVEGTHVRLDVGACHEHVAEAPKRLVDLLGARAVDALDALHEYSFPRSQRPDWSTLPLDWIPLVAVAAQAEGEPC